ncbi:MAG: hypothetical protein QF619_00435 [Candidatus Binatia bacterium]|mgnify:CR=1 FL=1|jgi:hypothetical protein|nr:hypothetical protein [Candidatus Binatia bacterium]
MAQWKMFDSDGHIREVEQEVFECLPEGYRKRREALLYSPLLPHHGWHRQAINSPGGGPQDLSSILIAFTLPKRKVTAI